MATNAIRARGLDEALSVLDRQIKNMPKVALKGKIEAAFKVQADAQRLTPVDTSNLRNSAFTVWPRKILAGSSKTVPSFQGKDADERRTEYERVTKEERAALNEADPTKLAVETGFTAAYAFVVHEDMDTDHPGGGQAKFLEASVISNLDDIIRILKANIIDGIDGNPKAPSQ